MLVPVKALAGLADIPAGRTFISKWINRNNIQTVILTVKGGPAHAVHLTDLPEDVQRAWRMRDLAAAGLDQGAFDDAAWQAYFEAPPRMRAKAEERAKLARFLVTEGRALSWSQKTAEAARRFGPVGTSTDSLQRIAKSVEGVSACGNWHSDRRPL